MEESHKKLTFRNFNIDYLLSLPEAVFGKYIEEYEQKNLSTLLDGVVS